MLNYLPIVPKASIYVQKVMRKPVMGGNTVSETCTHMFLIGRCVKFRKVAQAAKYAPRSFKKWPRQPNWSVMAEHGREGCVELSSHHAQSLHICPKGNAQTSYEW